MHNPLAAFRWLEDIDKTVELAANFPMVGESAEQYGEGIRKISQGSYVILFRPLPKHLELVRVLHGSRDIDSLLD